jgi:hypothetical protein
VVSRDQAEFGHRTRREGGPQAGGLAARLSYEALRYSFHDVNVDRVTEGLAGGGVGLREILQVTHALQASALAHGHVPAFPRNHGDLARGERHERRSGGWTLRPDAGGAKLNDGMPEVTWAVFPVPLQLLKAWKKV